MQQDFCASWVWYITVIDKTDPYSDPICVWKISEEFGHLNQTWKEKIIPKPGYQVYSSQKLVITFEIRIKLWRK